MRAFTVALDNESQICIDRNTFGPAVRDGIACDATMDALRVYRKWSYDERPHKVVSIPFARDRLPQVYGFNTIFDLALDFATQDMYDAHLNSPDKLTHVGIEKLVAVSCDNDGIRPVGAALTRSNLMSEDIALVSILGTRLHGCMFIHGAQGMTIAGEENANYRLITMSHGAIVIIRCTSGAHIISYSESVLRLFRWSDICDALSSDESNTFQLLASARYGESERGELNDIATILNERDKRDREFAELIAQLPDLHLTDRSEWDASSNLHEHALLVEQAQELASRWGGLLQLRETQGHAVTAELIGNCFREVRGRSYTNYAITLAYKLLVTSWVHGVPIKDVNMYELAD